METELPFLIFLPLKHSEYPTRDHFTEGIVLSLISSWKRGEVSDQTLLSIHKTQKCGNKLTFYISYFMVSVDDVLDSFLPRTCATSGFFFSICSNSHPVLNLQPEARLCVLHLGVRVLIYLSRVFIYFLMG